MAIYKVSIVVLGRRDLGAVQDFDQEPKPGDIVELAQQKFKIIEIVELMPPRDPFIYLQAVTQSLLSDTPHEKAM